MRRTNLVATLLGIAIVIGLLVPSDARGQAGIPQPRIWVQQGDSIYPVTSGLNLTGFDTLKCAVVSAESLLSIPDSINVDHIKLNVNLLGGTAYGVLDSLQVDHLRLGAGMIGGNLLGPYSYAELDSIDTRVLTTDSIRVSEHIEADSINVDHITGVNAVLSGPISADSVEADHHVGVDAVFSGPVSADSIEADHHVGVDAVFSGPVSADSIEADHHVGVNAVFSGPVSADSVEADHFSGGVTANFRYLSSTGALNLTSSNTYADGETAGTDISVAIYNSGNHGTLNLPSAATIDGRVLFITSTLHVTIDPNGAERIHGAATFDIFTDDSIVIWSDGSNWWILAAYSI